MSMPRWTTVMVGVVLGLNSLAVLGCKSRGPSSLGEAPNPLANAEVDQRLHLVARVLTPTGSTAEWYEPTPGGLVFTEVGTTKTKPFRNHVHLRDVPATEAFHIIAPSLPLPQALVEAQRRVEARVPKGVPVSRTKAKNESRAATAANAPQIVPENVPPGDPNVGCSPPWFYNNVNEGGYFCNTPNWSSSWCFYDTGPGAWDNGTGLNQDDAAICAVWTDNVVLNVNRSDGNGNLGNIPILTQTWRTWSAISGCGFFGCDSYDYHVTITGNGGDMQFAGGVIFN